jgi:hypothetical protein
MGIFRAFVKTLPTLDISGRIYEDHRGRLFGAFQKAPFILSFAFSK